MSRLTRWRPGGGSEPPVASEFGLVFLLLVAVALSTAVTVWTRTLVDALHPAPLSWRVTGAALVGTVTVALLVGVYNVVQSSVDGDYHPDPLEQAQAGLTVWGLLVVLAYMVFSTELAKELVGGLLTPVASTFAIALLALGYARVRGVRLRTTLPGRSALPPVGLAVAVPVAVVVIAAVAQTVSQGSTNPVFGTGRFFTRPALPSFLVGSLVPSLLFGSAFGLLFNGVVQESFREHLSPSARVGTVTVLGGLCFSPVAQSAGSFGGAPVTVVATVGLAVVAAAVVGRGWQSLAGADERARAAVVAAAVGVGVWYLVVDPGYPGLVVSPAGYAVTFGAAGVAYERARSVWVPMLAVAAYHLALDAVAYLQAPSSIELSTQLVVGLL